MAEESNFNQKVKNYIESQGGWFIKYWAGSKYTKEGIPDILACIHGRFYGIEDKASDGRPRLLQLVNLKKIRAAGGIGILLYPKDFPDFKALVDESEAGFKWYRENIKAQHEWFDKLVK